MQSNRMAIGQTDKSINKYTEDKTDKQESEIARLKNGKQMDTKIEGHTDITDRQTDRQKDNR